MPARIRTTWTLTIAAGLGLAISGEASAQATAKKAQPQVQPKAKAAATAPAPVDPAAVQAQAIAAQKANDELNKLLVDWETQSRKVQSLYVEFNRTDRSMKFGETLYGGKALLKSPDLACLEQVKCKLDAQGQPIWIVDPVTKKKKMDLEKEPDQRIVCSGTEVLEFAWDTKVVFVYPLNKDIRQKALQEGPLPFLFNMKAAQVKQRYLMKLMEPTDDFHVIQIVPIEQIDKASFERAFLWLGKSDFLPHRLQLFKVQKEVSTYDFTKIMPNMNLDDIFFHPDRNLAGWQVKVNPDDNAPAQRVAVPGPVKPGTTKRAAVPAEQGMNPANGRPR